MQQAQIKRNRKNSTNTNVKFSFRSTDLLCKHGKLLQFRRGIAEILGKALDEVVEPYLGGALHNTSWSTLYNFVFSAGTLQVIWPS
jgi:hypothetical protein